MTLEEEKNRVVELTKILEQTAAQHHLIMGRLTEARERVALAEEKAKQPEPESTSVVDVSPDDSADATF